MSSVLVLAHDGRTAPLRTLVPALCSGTKTSPLVRAHAPALVLVALIQRAWPEALRRINGLPQKAPPLFTLEEFLYQNQKRAIGGWGPRLSEVVQMLQVASSRNRTFMWIDALDECTASGIRLLDWLNYIPRESPGTRMRLVRRLHIQAGIGKRLSGRVTIVRIALQRLCHAISSQDEPGYNPGREGKQSGDFDPQQK